MPRQVRIGTRASPMAAHQAEQVADALLAHNHDVSIELIKITTSGDMWLGDLSKLGGKRAPRRSGFAFHTWPSPRYAAMPTPASPALTRGTSTPSSWPCPDCTGSA